MLVIPEFWFLARLELVKCWYSMFLKNSDFSPKFLTHTSNHHYHIFILEFPKEILNSTHPKTELIFPLKVVQHIFPILIKHITILSNISVTSDYLILLYPASLKSFSCTNCLYWYLNSAPYQLLTDWRNILINDLSAYIVSVQFLHSF